MKARLRRRLQFGALGVVLVAAITTIALTILPDAPAMPAQSITYTRPPRARGADWSAYLMNATNASFNSHETTVSPAEMPHLRPIGVFTVKDNPPANTTIATSVVSIGNTLYFGAWDGYEYALDATTYAVRWRVFLGVTTPPAADQCYPTTAGVTSNATVIGDNLYVGGGAGAVYDLDATTGTIIWQTQIATPPTEFIWSSPAIYHNHLYIGISSYGDCPLTRGRIDMLDAATGKLLKVHHLVTGSELGNGVWNKPVIDTPDNAVIFDTGNGPAGNPESQAVVALNLDTFTLLPQGAWSIPTSQVFGDSDFGASCTLVPDVGQGERGVVCHNKNSYLYALRVTPLGLSYAWSIRLGEGGDSPENGQGDVCDAVFDGRYLYVATSNLIYKGKPYASAVYKLDPTTASVLWITPVKGYYSVNALAGANGILVMGLTDHTFQNGALDIFSMETGKVIYHQPLSAGVLAAPSIANGEIYVPTLDGHLFVYGLPAAFPEADDSFTNGVLPAGWKWLGYQPKDAQASADGVKITAQAHTTPVSANLLTKSLPPNGDFLIEALVDNPQVNSDAGAGVVAFGSAENYVSVMVTTDAEKHQIYTFSSYYQGKLVSYNRASFHVLGAGAVHVELIHTGNFFGGYASLNGVDWIEAGSSNIPLNVTLGGIGVSAPTQAMQAPATFAWCQISSLSD